MISLSAPTVLSCTVSLLHFGFGYLESFGWLRGAARRFGMKKEDAVTTSNLAANQAYYNAVLAAGLAAGIYLNDWNLEFFFLTAVHGCGLVGALTASPRILLLQSGPAIAALTAKFMTNRNAFSNSHLITLAAVSVVSIGYSLAIKRHNKAAAQALKK
jgi:putative membrane protein